MNASVTDYDVAYVGYVLGPGGDALQMLDLARGVRDRGARVRIIVPQIESSEGFAERCRALDLACERNPLITPSPHFADQKLNDAVKLLRSIREPIAHFHTGNSFLPIHLMFALELVRFRRCLVTIQSPYESIKHGGKRARAWAILSRRRFAAVVCPSDHGARYQLHCGLPSSVVTKISNSVDVAAMQRGDSAAARRHLDVDADVPLVVATSRLDGQKRPVESVRIFAAGAADVPEALLVFVGHGSEEGAIVAESERLGIAERVRLVGYQTNIPDWLAASSVWLLPTERENFSVAVLEAMAAGCTILSTTCPGNDEVLVDGDNARTFAVGDVDTASAALAELLADPDQRSRLGATARQRGSEYSLDKMVDSYVRLYRQVEHCPPSLRATAGAGRALDE